MLVSFVARALSNIRGNIFCYSAISSSGVILILPGFTIRKPPLDNVRRVYLHPVSVTSALELMSKNLFCGSVRLVYAIIYTLFLVGYFSMPFNVPLLTGKSPGLQSDYRL